MSLKKINKRIFDAVFFFELQSQRRRELNIVNARDVRPPEIPVGIHF